MAEALWTADAPRAVELERDPTEMAVTTAQITSATGAGTVRDTAPHTDRPTAGIKE